ncbi:attractin-like protein 1 [Oppia nitens]|uniref:attractin-like protein 1 n=1 Tax=Oppia nitens TaxID=1686743 RepID=UPI0023DA217F|nr:attractin-like protein 1 [Oppia nitens]
MMASVQVLVYLIRAKFKRKCLWSPIDLLFVSIVLCELFAASITGHSISLSSPSTCGDVLCFHGICHDGRCICDAGWQGSACHRCGGRIKLDTPSGYISDGIGNYSTDLQCTWIIDSGLNDSVIRLDFVHFETECSWDHLYIFDGDSVFSPVLAAFSGVLVKDGQSFQQIPEITARSGRAYLYFYSDAAYNMSGFNISYSINTCPKNCSGHGVCVSRVDGCTCDAGWEGDACDRPICPNNCSYPNGLCDREQHICICQFDYMGPDCSQSQFDGYWAVVNAIKGVKGRALHQSVIYDSSMFVIGGEYYEPEEFLMKFDLKMKKWESFKANKQIEEETPGERFGHSVVVYDNKLIMFGGMTKNGTINRDLWAYDISKQQWKLWIDGYDYYLKPCSPSVYCSPLPVIGHSANFIDNTMIVIFGYNPVYGYLNVVQEFNFSTRTWQIITTRGAIVKGGFGHSSVYDPMSKLIYVFGGYHSLGSSDTLLVDLLYGYNHRFKSWFLLNPSPSPRYLHTATIINGLMFVFGGNGYNATTNNSGDRCFSPQFLAYDIACDAWRTLKDPSPSLLLNDRVGLGRYGHSSVLYNDSIYMFGGFNGVMLSSILKYSPGDCRRFVTNEECAKMKTGNKCVWNKDKNVCQLYSAQKSTQLSNLYSPCDVTNTNFTELCQKQTLCPSCLENTYGCVWCSGSGQCQYQKCRKTGVKDDLKSISDSSRCEDDIRSSNCDKLHNCHSCHTEYQCGWQRDSKCYTFVREVNNKSEKAPAILRDDLKPSCEEPCHTRTTCENCTAGSCMWCSSSRRCIESNAYAAIFPIAQCMEWTIHPYKCAGLTCSDIQTCDKCLKNPLCGWCDDGTGTGVGTCLEGSASGPYTWNGTDYSLKQSACPVTHWHFSHCPECQCNGHSHCLTSNVCHKCQQLTEGSHCQYCMAGFYGNPINGGNCTPCSCHSHSVFCNRESGKCHCTTKGITGHHCEKCDEQNNYIGNPQEEGGSCFYNLTMGYQYTFNMSKPDDRFYTRINFMNVPMTPDIDVEFMIQCQESALVNISIGSASFPIRNLHERLECGNFKLRFSHDENLFGIENTTFYVNVFAFSTPFVLQISFSQHRTLDLLQFFVTFSSCFLTLLIIAAILWKIKQKYDLYRRRQQLFVEMEQMASRPFATVVLYINRDQNHLNFNKDNLQTECDNPTPIALEPCNTGKAAVLSLIVRLPTGGLPSTPPGQTGIAIASALVSLGTVPIEQKSNKDTDNNPTNKVINSSNKLNNYPSTTTTTNITTITTTNTTGV